MSATTRLMITCIDHQMHHISSTIYAPQFWNEMFVKWSWVTEINWVLKTSFFQHLNNLGNILLHGNLINLKQVYVAERYDDGMEKYRWLMRENIFCSDILSKFCCMCLTNCVIDGSMIIDGKLVLKSMFSHIRVHICHFLNTVLTCCVF